MVFYQKYYDNIGWTVLIHFFKFNPSEQQCKNIYVNPHMNILSLPNIQSHLCYDISKCHLHEREKSAECKVLWGTTQANEECVSVQQGS